MTITFDTKLGLRRSKNKVAQNCAMKLVSNPKGDSDAKICLKFNCLLLFFF